jgi:hypothetical protein
MKRLQHWFDQIIGIALIEEERRALAREIFSQRTLSESLALPACWRRSPRIVIGHLR